MAGVPAAPAKAELKTEKNETIKFLFNPSELTITKAATWNSASHDPPNTPLMNFRRVTL